MEPDDLAFGLPSSSSHALFGGLIGAVVVGAGIASVNGWVIVSKVLLPAIVAPFVAGIAAAWATRLAYGITRKTRASTARLASSMGKPLQHQWSRLLMAPPMARRRWV